MARILVTAATFNARVPCLRASRTPRDTTGTPPFARWASPRAPDKALPVSGGACTPSPRERAVGRGIHDTDNSPHPAAAPASDPRRRGQPGSPSPVARPRRPPPHWPRDPPSPSPAEPRPRPRPRPPGPAPESRRGPGTGPRRAPVPQPRWSWMATSSPCTMLSRRRGGTWSSRAGTTRTRSPSRSRSAPGTWWGTRCSRRSTRQSAATAWGTASSSR